jgi:hypothetical protein
VTAIMAIKSNHILFGLWLIASIFWAMQCSDHFRFGNAIDTYATAMDLANQIADRSATSYQKKLYMDYSARIEAVNGRILLFMATGVGVPLVVLFLGRWMLSAPKKKSPAKSPQKPDYSKKKPRW